MNQKNRLIRDTAEGDPMLTNSIADCYNDLIYKQDLHTCVVTCHNLLLIEAFTILMHLMTRIYKVQIFITPQDRYM